MNKRLYERACKELKKFEEGESDGAKRISAIALELFPANSSKGRNATITEGITQWIADSGCTKIQPGTLKKYRLTAQRYIENGNSAPTWGAATFTVHVLLEKHEDRWDLTRSPMTLREARDIAGRQQPVSTFGSGDSFTNLRSAVGFANSAKRFIEQGIMPHENQAVRAVELAMELSELALELLEIFDPTAEMRPVAT